MEKFNIYQHNPVKLDEIWKDLEIKFSEPFSIRLEAINAENNIHRFYEIHLSRDLFNQWTLQTLFGRIGSSGTLKSYGLDNLKDALKQIRFSMKKRLNAINRIGVNYVIMDR